MSWKLVFIFYLNIAFENKVDAWKIFEPSVFDLEKSLGL